MFFHRKEHKTYMAPTLVSSVVALEPFILRLFFFRLLDLVSTFSVLEVSCRKKKAILFVERLVFAGVVTMLVTRLKKRA